MSVSDPLVPSGAVPDTRALTVSVDLVVGRITLSGEFDRDSAHHLMDAVSALVPSRHARWELDAAAVTFCDAGGLRALSTASAFATRLNRSLVVVRASRCVHRLITLVGADLFITTAADTTTGAAAGPDDGSAAVRRPASRTTGQGTRLVACSSVR